MNGCQESPMLDDAPIVNPIILIGKKRCSKCRNVMEISEFRKDSRNKDGLCSSCNPCARKYAARYRQVNTESCRVAQKLWVTANPEKSREAGKRWKKANILISGCHCE